MRNRLLQADGQLLLHIADKFFKRGRLEEGGREDVTIVKDSGFCVTSAVQLMPTAYRYMEQT